jgi:hypothetical protein
VGRRGKPLPRGGAQWSAIAAAAAAHGVVADQTEQKPPKVFPSSIAVRAIRGTSASSPADSPWPGESNASTRNPAATSGAASLQLGGMAFPPVQELMSGYPRGPVPSSDPSPLCFHPTRRGGGQIGLRGMRRNSRSGCKHIAAASSPSTSSAARQRKVRQPATQRGGEQEFGHRPQWEARTPRKSSPRPQIAARVGISHPIGRTSCVRKNLRPGREDGE